MTTASMRTREQPSAVAHALILLSTVLSACDEDQRAARADSRVADASYLEASAQGDFDADTETAPPEYVPPGELTATRPDAGAASCPAELSDCPATRTGLKVLLRAQDVEASARFVDVDGDATLAVTSSGEARVVMFSLDPYDLTVTSTQWLGAPSSLSFVAVVQESRWATEEAPGVFVLACDGAGIHCEVSRGTPGSDRLESFTAAALPPEFVAKGLVLDYATTSPTLCAFGNGLLCLEDSWKPAIEPTADLRVNDVTMGYSRSFAVGDEGRWYIRTRVSAAEPGVWLEQPPLGRTALTRVAVRDQGGVILGGGVVQATLGSQSGYFECLLSNKLADIFLSTLEEGFAELVTSQGEIIRNASPDRRVAQFCIAERLDIEPLIATSEAPCELSTNPRLLTATTLLGLQECYRLGL